MNGLSERLRMLQSAIGIERRGRCIQGTPMAVEDAVQMGASLLQHGGVCPEALSHYQRVRRDRVLPVWEESTRQAVAYYSERDAGANPMTSFRDTASGFDPVKFTRDYEAPPLQAADAAAAA